VFRIAGPLLLLICYLLGQRWQGQIRDLVQAEPEGFGSKLWLPVVAMLVFVGLWWPRPGVSDGSSGGRPTGWAGGWGGAPPGRRAGCWSRC
jgi:hypothetical protein